MKYQEFATENFIGLKSIQKHYMREKFSFRKHQATLQYTIAFILFKINELKYNIQNDY